MPWSLIGVPDEVVALFERFTLEVINRGFKRYSSDAILHRIRWHYHIERTGHEDFKCNNNWTADLARWFMDNHPSHTGFFELRVRKSYEHA